MTEDTQENRRIFRLRPFTSGPAAGELSLSGSLARVSDTLLAEYRLYGSLESIKQPPASIVSSRSHELWRRTCFEFFFGICGEPGYWEVNVGLGGGWNVYRFDGYRMGMREEIGVDEPQCRVSTGTAAGTDYLSVSCTICLNGLIDDSLDLEAGISGVIESSDGSISYWAIEHRGRQPDFHDRDSFLLVLPGGGGPLQPKV